MGESHLGYVTFSNRRRYPVDEKLRVDNIVALHSLPESALRPILSIDLKAMNLHAERPTLSLILKQSSILDNLLSPTLASNETGSQELVEKIDRY